MLCITGEIETQEVYPWADAADSVTTLRISEGVTEIPAGAFQNFSALQYVTIPKTLRYIGSSAFENCALLRWVRMPDGLVGIGEKAFAGCTKLAPVYLPESVAWIGDRAFDVSAVLNGRRVRMHWLLPRVPGEMREPGRWKMAPWSSPAAARLSAAQTDVIPGMPIGRTFRP